MLLLASACGQPTESDDSLSSTQAQGLSTAVPAEIAALPQVATRVLCDHNTAPGVMHCNARIRTDLAPQSISPMATPSGLGPPDIQSAYKLPSTGGSTMTVAIVDAMDDPNAEADLAKYRSQYGLPACTTANGCFKKVNQTGVQGSYPTADKGWAGEIALDLDMVSAACPNCKILLVEASSASMDALGTAVNTAVKLGASVVSNSYGGSEDSTSASADTQYFNHPGVTITVSSGDSGYGVEYPASSQYVTAVGGTSLTKSTGTSRGWVESVWGTAANTNGGAGSGCSAYITKPSWQKDTGCAKRMVADVAAVADPATGVAVYDTYGGTGWAVYGGTSAASPLVAAIYALTGHANAPLGFAYANTGAFFDVTSGTNGSCGSTYQCKAGTGYDGPTGLGTPNGAVMTSGTGTGGGTCSTSSQLLLSPDFETSTGWTATSGVLIAATSTEPAHGGSNLADLDGYGSAHTDTLYQTVTIPSAACSASLSFWLRVNSSETTTTTAYDKLTAQVQNSSGTSLATLATYSNLNKGAAYSQKTFDLSAYKGQTIRIYFSGTEDSQLATDFLIDDATLSVTQ